MVEHCSVAAVTRVRSPLATPTKSDFLNEVVFCYNLLEARHTGFYFFSLW